MTVETTRRARRRARRVQARRDAGSLTAALPLWALPYAVMAVPWVYTIQGVYDVPTSAFAVTLAVLVPFAAVLFLLARLTRWQRARLRVVRGVAIADAEAPGFTWSRAGVREALQAEATWRQAYYHLVVGPLVGLAYLLAATVTGACLAGVAFFGWVLVQPPGADGPGRGLFWAGFLVVLFGFPFLLLVPRLVRALSRADAEAARRLLGPNQTVELIRRVDALAAGRAAAVDAADAERRRIERDLHDGAQQRLMSLAMNLGLARKTLRGPSGASEEAMRVIVEAHEQAKEAMTELRDLIRGLHPAVLDDRGLDAALSGIAARSPVPVRLAVELDLPLPPSVETVAYFVVSEALANVAKHSSATEAAVDVRAAADLLFVRIADDGVGGADPGRGTGLAGLAQRVASIDGALRVSSPIGGPTILTAELPCRI